MRFLLYSSAATRVSKTKTAVVPSAAEELACTAIAPRRTWGQQCSPSCGCVVRFEAEHAAADSESSFHQNSSYRLSYSAKCIVSIPGKQRRQAVLTPKGRPMLQACHCKSLHHLSALLVDYYNHNKNNDWGRMRSDLEFQSLRSSRSFQRSVLQSQGLPPTATHCFDVVEEAWTALVKGHIPSARSAENSSTTNDQEEDDLYDYPEPERRSTFFSLNEDDYQRDNYQVSSPFDWTSKLSLPLRMFDLSQEQREMEERKEAEKERQKQLDWQSYVDQLYYEESRRIKHGNQVTA